MVGDNVGYLVGKPVGVGVGRFVGFVVEGPV